MKRLFFLLLALTFAQLAHAQGVPITFPYQYTNSAGTGPAALAYVCTYAAGTTTSQPTYSNATLSSPNPNPTRLNAAGRPSVSSVEVQQFLDPTKTYKINLYASGSGNTCNGTSVGSLIWSHDNIRGSAGVSVGYISMVHDSAQPTGWTVYDQTGAQVDTSSSTTQGLQEAINLAQTTSYDLLVFGGGINAAREAHSRIVCSTPITIPAREGISIKFIGEVDLVYTGAAASDFITIDTMDLSDIDFTDVQIVYPGTGTAVVLAPTGSCCGGFIGMTSSRISIGTIAVVDSGLAPDNTRGTGFKISSTTHSIIGMDITVREINGSLIGFQIDSPTGSPPTGVEYNDFKLYGNHHMGTTGVKIGTSTTNAARLGSNKFLALVHMDTSSGGCFDIYGVNNQFNMACQTSAGTGVTLETSAAKNQFLVSANNSATKWVDNSTSKDNQRIDSESNLLAVGGTATDATLAGAALMTIGNNSSFLAAGATTNASMAVLGITNGSYAFLSSTRSAAGGTYLPLAFFTNNTEAARFTTGGNFLLGGTTTDLTLSTPTAVAIGATSGFVAVTAASNASTLSLTVSNGVETGIVSGKTGGGSALPMNLYVGTTNVAQFKTSGTDRTCIYVNGGLRLMQVSAGHIVDGGAC